MRRKGTAEELERTRMIAANLFDQKFKTRQIAMALGVDVQTVRRWRRVYLADGREALKLNKHPGRPPLLGETDRQKLATLLLKTPAECGLDRHLWTTQLIAELIEREFKIHYHHDHVGVILAAMGFTHQKPARRARERDEARIHAWRHETWPALLKKASQPTA
jgi:putative transposase